MLLSELAGEKRRRVVFDETHFGILSNPVCPPSSGNTGCTDWSWRSHCRGIVCMAKRGAVCSSGNDTERGAGDRARTGCRRGLCDCSNGTSRRAICRRSALRSGSARLDTVSNLTSWRR